MGETNYTVGIRTVSTSDDAALIRATESLKTLRAQQDADKDARIARIPIIQAENSAMQAGATAAISVEEALSKLTPAERQAAQATAERAKATQDAAQADLKAQEQAQANAEGSKMFGDVLEHLVGKWLSIIAVLETAKEAIKALWEAFQESVKVEHLYVTLANNARDFAGATEEDNKALREWTESITEFAGVGESRVVPFLERLISVTKSVHDSQLLTQMGLKLEKDYGISLEETLMTITNVYEGRAIPARSQFGKLLLSEKQAGEDDMAVLRRFVETHGDLATVTQDGALKQAQLSEAWAHAKEAVGALAQPLADILVPAMKEAVIIAQGLATGAKMLEMPFKTAASAAIVLGKSIAAVKEGKGFDTFVALSKEAVGKLGDEFSATAKKGEALRKAALGMGEDAKKALEVGFLTGHKVGGAEEEAAAAKAAAEAEAAAKKAAEAQAAAMSKERQAVQDLEHSYVDLAKTEHQASVERLRGADGEKAITDAAKAATQTRLNLLTMEVTAIKANEARTLSDEGNTQKARVAIHQKALLDIKAAEQRSETDIVKIHKTAAAQITKEDQFIAKIKKSLAADVTKFIREQEAKQFQIEQQYNRLISKADTMLAKSQHQGRLKELADERQKLINFAMMNKLTADQIKRIWEEVAGITTQMNAESKKQMALDDLTYAEAFTTVVTAIFGQSKAAQYAMAVINTARGITEAIPVIPLMVMAAATGAAEIAAIASTSMGKAAKGAYADIPTPTWIGEAGPELVLPPHFTALFDAMAQAYGQSGGPQSVSHDNSRRTSIQNVTVLGGFAAEAQMRELEKMRRPSERAVNRSIVSRRITKAGSVRSL